MVSPLDPRLVVGWDAHNWAKALPWWRAHLPPGAGLRVLELGCGPGGVSLWLASLGHRVTCSDLELPGPAVRRLHAAHGFASGIEYAALDATDLPYQGAFDVVVTKSVLGGVGFDHDLGRVERATGQIHRALKAGGRYLFAENLQGTWLHRTLRGRFRRWGSAWHYFERAELLGLLDRFSSVEERTVGFLGLFGWSEPVRRGLGALDTALFDRIAPASRRYILMGAARK